MIPKLPSVALTGVLSGALTGGAPLLATALEGLLSSTEVVEDAMTEIAAGGNGLAPILVPTTSLETVRKIRVAAREVAGIIQPEYVAPAMPTMTRALRGR